MNPRKPTNAVIARLVAAINDGDRAEFLSLLAPDAELTDDGRPRELAAWIDAEIFTVHGHLTVDREEERGLRIYATYRNDTWGEMSTVWHFGVSGEKITRIDTGQA